MSPTVVALDNPIQPYAVGLPDRPRGVSRPAQPFRRAGGRALDRRAPQGAVAGPRRRAPSGPSAPSSGAPPKPCWARASPGVSRESCPFLLKVIAAAEPLSIQCHPNREQARDGLRTGEPRGHPPGRLRAQLQGPEPQAGAGRGPDSLRRPQGLSSRLPRSSGTFASRPGGGPRAPERLRERAERRDAEGSLRGSSRLWTRSPGAAPSGGPSRRRAPRRQRGALGWPHASTTSTRATWAPSPRSS